MYELFKNLSVVALLVLNFIVTLSALLLVYQAYTIEENPSADDVKKIKTYGTILGVVILINFIGWLATVVSGFRS